MQALDVSVHARKGFNQHTGSGLKAAWLHAFHTHLHSQTVLLQERGIHFGKVRAHELGVSQGPQHLIMLLQGFSEARSVDLYIVYQSLQVHKLLLQPVPAICPQLAVRRCNKKSHTKNMNEINTGWQSDIHLSLSFNLLRNHAECSRQGQQSIAKAWQ